MRTLDLGRRVELVPMDPHCHDITLALYLSGHRFRVHTYSSREAALHRVAFLRKAMASMGGMRAVGGELEFECGHIHLAAVRRLFLTAAKSPTAALPAPFPLEVTDKKSGLLVSAVSLGSGRYELRASGPEEGKDARLAAIANGLKKLAEMSEEAGQLAFPCGQSHDPLAGLLLPRALNVRATLREEEQSASRGVLVAPSARKE